MAIYFIFKLKSDSSSNCHEIYLVVSRTGAASRTLVHYLKIVAIYFIFKLKSDSSSNCHEIYLVVSRTGATHP
ncbi:MAG: hypothetical protein WCT77_11995, partial [Bacteroidota bacterium]